MEAVCIVVVMMKLADNYDPNATEDSSCIYNGCTNLGNVIIILLPLDDGSCNYLNRYYDCDGKLFE